LRSGIGYDVHRLVEGRALILGGVVIPCEKGLEGHSDADVLIHAIMDALLGAAALGDIGRCFPDSEPRYKGISSILLLGQVKELINNAGFTINNIDSVIVAQKPKLAPFITEMVSTLAKALNIPVTSVNVKATTTEGLGFTGSGDGIAAYAVVSLEEGGAMASFELKTNKVKFESVGIYRAPESLQTVVEQNKSIENTMLLEGNGKYWVFMARGLKPTGGYAVKVTEMTIESMTDGKQRLNVFYRYSDPSPDKFVTQVMTYPTDLVLVKSLKKKPDDVVFTLVK
jgi:2-C-methyl-D-erythritol 2,4-cyclodiphosphate synthase